MNFLKSIFSKNEGDGDTRGDKGNGEKRELTSKTFINI